MISKKLLLIAVLCFSIQASTQQIENIWDLEKIVVDDNEIFPPFDSDIKMEIYFDFDIYVFYTLFCGDLSNGSGIWFDDTTLYIESLDQYYQDCEDEEFNEYRDLYFTTYLEDTDKNYSYNITQDANNHLELIITNEFGNQIIYSNLSLNTTSFSFANYKITPNPVSDYLHIEFENENNNIINLYTASGVIIRTYQNVSEIDVSLLSNGIYFLEIILNDNNKIVRKFVKH